MTAVIRFYRYGDPSVLTAQDEQIGDPGRGQVLLCHEVIGVNFVDTAFRDGTFKIPVCTENLIRVDDVMESPKLAE